MNNRALSSLEKIAEHLKDRCSTGFTVSNLELRAGIFAGYIFIIMTSEEEGIHMGKIIGGILAVLVVVLAVVIGLVYFNLDKIIIAAVEDYGSEVTKSEVTLAKVDIDMTSGKGGMKGLKVGNPEGFEEPSAFELGEISLAINVGETNGDLIHITSILVDAPRVTYELNANTNNLDTIKNNVDDFIVANGGGQSASTDEDGGGGPKIIIDSLIIQNGLVVVKAPITMNKRIEGSLPKLQLKDIGKEEGGSTPGEVAAIIVDAISNSAMGVVSNLGVGKTLESLSGALGGAAGSLTKGITGGDSTSGGAGKAVEGAAGAVKGLFK